MATEPGPNDTQETEESQEESQEVMESVVKTMRRLNEKSKLVLEVGEEEKGGNL